MAARAALSVRSLRITALTYVLVGVLAFLAVFRIFVTTAPGQRVDEIAFYGSALGRTQLWRFADPILDVVSVGFVALVIIFAATVAILRQRWLLIVQVGIVMGGANIATQLFKMLADRPDLGIVGTVGPAPGFNTLPSGHTTVAMTTVIAVLFVVPPRLRPIVAVLGTAYAAGTGVSTLVGGWHRASDVIAAMLMTFIFTGIALLIDRPRKRVPTGDDVAAIVLAIIGLVAAIISILALVTMWQGIGSDPFFDLVQNRETLSRREMFTAYAGGALGCVSVACAIVAAVVFLLQRRGD